MAALGSISLVSALVLAIFGVVAAALGIRLKAAELVLSARNALYGIYGLTTLASLALIAAFLTHDFQLSYVAQHSSRDMPDRFIIAAFYSGQQGSLLFWSWTLSIFAALVIALSWKQNRQLMPYVVAVLAGMQVFFLFLLAFVQSPFETLPFRVQDGAGLNPVLQDNGMLIHPPMMLMGYMSWSIPFAFALAALMSGRLDTHWLRSVRRWTLAGWCIQSVGLFLGAWWAYHVLGWGGYWGWDPVENAAFMPWLPATAFLHSVMVQERRGMLKVWNLVLIILAYLLAIFGTFIVRSGVLTSVHAFAQSSMGPFFFGWLALATALAIGLLVWRLPRLRPEHQFEALASREASFLFNNWLLLAALLAIFWGTIFPILSEAVRGQKITVAAPFYKAVSGPIFLALMLAMGIGPLLPWKRASPTQLWRTLATPAIAGLTVAAGLLVFGLRDGAAILGFTASAFVLATLILEFYRGTIARRRVTGKSTVAALLDLFVHHRRRYGGYVVHLAVVMIAVALVASQVYQITRQVTLGKGQAATIGGYRLTFEGLSTSRDVEKQTVSAGLSLPDGTVLLPGKNSWNRDDKNPSSNIVIRSTPLEDLYIVLTDWAPDQSSATFLLFVNPMVMWLWAGGILLVIGTVVTIWPDLQPARVKAAGLPRADAGRRPSLVGVS